MEFIVIAIIITIIIVFNTKLNTLSKKNKDLEYKIAQYESEQASSQNSDKQEEFEDLIFPIRDMENQKFNHRLRSGFFNGYLTFEENEEEELIGIHNDTGLLLGFLWVGEYYHQLLHKKYNGILNIYGYAKYNSYDKYWFGQIIAPYNIAEQDVNKAFNYFENKHQRIFNN